MSAHCCDHDTPKVETIVNLARYRKILWIALIVNAAMFLVEVAAGFQSVGTMVIDKAGGSRTLGSKTGMFDSSRYTNLDSPTTPADGLLVHYKFDGDLMDSGTVEP